MTGPEYYIDYGIDTIFADMAFIKNYGQQSVASGIRAADRHPPAPLRLVL